MRADAEIQEKSGEKLVFRLVFWLISAFAPRLIGVGREQDDQKGQGKQNYPYERTGEDTHGALMFSGITTQLWRFFCVEVTIKPKAGVNPFLFFLLRFLVVPHRGSNIKWHFRQRMRRFRADLREERRRVHWTRNPISVVSGCREN